MMQKSIKAGEQSKIPDNIVLFPTRSCHRIRRELEISYHLKHQPHFLILTLGAIIGTVLAFFLNYHLQHTLLHFLIFIIVPISVALFLRQIYIHTLIQSMKD